MKMSEKGLIELTSLEGCCLKPYYDSVGVITIGVGATRSEIPTLKDWDKSKAITMKEVFDLLRRSIVKYEDAVNRTLKNGTMLTQSQFDALVSICYNIGTGGLSKSTFMKRINSGARVGKLPTGLVEDYYEISSADRTDRSVEMGESVQLEWAGEGTIVDAILMWNKPREIMGRRKKEARLFSTGQYSNTGYCQLFETDNKGHILWSRTKNIRIKDYL